MDLDEIRRRLDEERRTLVRGADEIEVLPLVSRCRSRMWKFHWVIYSSLNEQNADAAIEQEIEHHRAIDAKFEWKLYAHDTPDDMIDRLRRHGFEIGPLEAVLILDLNDAPAWVDAPIKHDVIRLDRTEQVEMFRSVAEDVFDKEYAVTSDQLATAIREGDKGHLGYVALCDGVPASIGRLYTHPDSHFGGLYGGGTIEQYRGLGLYRSLVAARARDARKFGARYLIVDALPTSRPILERLGFVHLTDTWPCEWSPGLTSAPE
jgi:hypothetical protein